MRKLYIADFISFPKSIGNLYDQKILQAAQKCEITKPEADVLLFLHNNKEMDTAGDMVKYRGLSKAYVSKAVCLLFEKQYIIINVDKSDRRYQHISLTKSGESVACVLKKSQTDFFEYVTDGVDIQDFNTFMNVVSALMKNVAGRNTDGK